MQNTRRNSIRAKSENNRQSYSGDMDHGRDQIPELEIDGVQNTSQYKKPIILENFFYPEHDPNVQQSSKPNVSFPAQKATPRKFDFLSRQELDVIESLHSKSRSSQSLSSIISPVLKDNALFVMYQQGTAISVLNIQNEHDKDLLLHLIESQNSSSSGKSEIRFSRNIYLPDKCELIIHTDNFADCDKLKELLRQSGVKDANQESNSFVHNESRTLQGESLKKGLSWSTLKFGDKNRALLKTELEQNLYSTLPAGGQKTF